MGSFDAHIISWVTFLPLATGLLLLAIGVSSQVFLRSEGLSAAAWRVVAFASSIVTFFLSVFGMWFRYEPQNSGFQLTEHVSWLPAFGVNYFVGVDGISLVLVVLTTFLMPIVFLASWNDVKSSLRSFVFFMLFLETAMIGTFVALNLFQFYVFWEVMLIPMYFIIGIWGGARRVYAAVKFFLFTMAGSLLMLIALLVVYRLNFEQGGALNLDLISIPGVAGKGLLETVIPTGGDAPWWQTQFWLFAAFALAFGIKVPMVPAHTWLPDAHVEAPTAGSVILAGVLLKMGTYGFVRFALPLFPEAASGSFFVSLIFGLSLVGIVYGSLIAMVQKDIKKLVAYSSVAHLGFVMLGLFAFNVQGLTGGVLQMVNHGLSTGALFLLVGFLYERRHTREIAEFGGIARPMPVYAAFFGIAMMSSIGLPALNGFVGEFLILLGTFEANAWVAVVATSGVILAACYMLWMYRRVMFGPVDNPENRGLMDLDWREKSVMIAITIPIIWIGVYPNPFLRVIEPSAIEVLQQVEGRRSQSAAIETPAVRLAESEPLPVLVPADPHAETAGPEEAAAKVGEAG